MKALRGKRLVFPELELVDVTVKPGMPGEKQNMGRRERDRTQIMVRSKDFIFSTEELKHL